MPILQHARALAAAAALAFAAASSPACVAATDAIDEDADGAATAPLSNVSQDDVDHFWHALRAHDDPIHTSWHENSGGRAWAGDFLAWHESLVEESLFEMYEATHDVAFLDELHRRIRQVMDLRDDHIDRRDEIRHRVMKAWGRFPDVGRDHRTGTWVVEMEQNGMITYPMAAFVHVVLRSYDLKERYGEDDVRHLRDQLVDTVDAFDDEWHGAGDGGFYRFPSGYGRIWPDYEGAWLPYNRPLSLGRTMMLLAESGVGEGHQHRFHERVRKMAKFFLDHVHYGNGRATWLFAPNNTGMENVGHGSIDAHFIAMAGQRGYTSVGHHDVEHFVGTFEHVTSNRRKIAWTVDGDHDAASQKDADQDCGRWLDLAKYHAHLVDRCRHVIEHGFDSHQVGFAKSLHYRR